MPWVVFDAEDYWDPTPTSIDEERQLWWCVAHASSERIEDILSTWNKPPAHFCDQRLYNSPLHNAAWHIEKLTPDLQQTLVPKLMAVGIEVDALNANDQTALHMMGARLEVLQKKEPQLVKCNLEFVAQLVRYGSQRANKKGEHPLIAFLSHCQSTTDVDNILSLFSNNGADLGLFFNDPLQLNQPKISQWSTYLTQRAADEQNQRLVAAIVPTASPTSKRKM